jgi:hypothetical protein
MNNLETYNLNDFRWAGAIHKTAATMLPNESYNQMLNRLNGGTFKALGFLGYGQKSHVIEVSYVRLNNELVILGYRPICATRTSFTKSNIRDLGKEPITCNKCTNKLTK